MHTIQKQPDGLYRVVFQWTDDAGRNLYNEIVGNLKFSDAVRLVSVLNGSDRTADATL